MLSLSDIQHLDAAERWLERGDYPNCFHELERIDFNNREDQRVFALPMEALQQIGPTRACRKPRTWHPTAVPR